MEKPPNNFKEGPESFDEHEDLIKYYEDLNAQEALKPKVEYGPHAEEFEKMLVPLLEEGLLAALNTIETEEEAMSSKERASAKEALIPLVSKMNFLKNRTDIDEKEFEKLHEQYKIISNAVGFINEGKVDHNR
ncbi:MAG: hypothetical protein BMS9Abin13_240 [Patescibacteria group bacterium]|nr:MAG: hypothetical protein BMS9Abin13_240 [Patescibacteria group bacterium]